MRITVQGVSVRYASHPALVEAELSVKEGEILTLVGPNGAGKSTLLRTIAGTLAPTSGGGLPGPAKRSGNSGQTTGQNPGHGGTGGGAELRLHRARAGGARPHSPRTQIRTPGKRRRRSCGKSPSALWASRRWSGLSGGERQRALLAMAFAQEPRVLLLAEPIAHLDVAHQIELMQVIASWAEEGITVIMALHDLNLAAAFAHRLVLLHRGKIVAQGRPPEVLTPPT